MMHATGNRDGDGGGARLGRGLPGTGILQAGILRAGVLLALLTGLSASLAAGGEVFDQRTLDFAAKVDVRELSLLAVRHNGRATIMDTLARDRLEGFYGDSRVDGTPPTFAYLELSLNARAYENKPLIYIQERNMRGLLERLLEGPALEDFRRTRRLPPGLLLSAVEMSGGMAGGHPAMAGAASAPAASQSAAESSTQLREALGELSAHPEYRLALDRLSSRVEAYMQARSMSGGPGSMSAAPEWIAAQPKAMSETWAALSKAWQARDADKVAALAQELSRESSAQAGEAQPSRFMRQLELAYNGSYRTTIVFAGFAAALLAMIYALAGKRRWARRVGLGIFCVSTLALLGGFVVRWLLSGRPWYLPPIMNQFEAVTGSALLGAVVALGLEWRLKRNIFALAAAFYATVALLAGFFLPQRMGASIGAMPGILNSPIMAAHVAVIIIGHAFVGMTCIVSLLYLTAAAAGKWKKTLAASTGADLAEGGDALPPADERTQLLVPLEGTTLETIDRCNLILAQLACWMVLAGTVLGAWWGDFAWGRWWGWDPKETWALITGLAYVAVLHVRFVVPPSRRGLWTAVGCIVGTAVMLFNWIYVNYFISGMHSYA